MRTTVRCDWATDPLWLYKALDVLEPVDRFAFDLDYQALGLDTCGRDRAALDNLDNLVLTRRLRA